MTLFSVFIHAEANDSYVPQIIIFWHAKLKCSWCYRRFVTSEPLYRVLCALNYRRSLCLYILIKFKDSLLTVF